MENPEGQCHQSNTTLADAYFRINRPYNRDLTTFHTIARLIRESSVDITAFFKEKGNLDRLKIPGIGKTTIQTLTAILLDGAAAASSRIIEERINTMREQVVGFSRRGSGIIEDNDRTEDNDE